MTATLTDDDVVTVPDHLPPPCWVAAAYPDFCPDRFAEWIVNRHCRCCTVLLCTPCKDRWASYGTVHSAVRL